MTSEQSIARRLAEIGSLESDRFSSDLVDWIDSQIDTAIKAAVASGSARTIDTALNVAAMFGPGSQSCSVIGRRERLPLQWATFVNGVVIGLGLRRHRLESAFPIAAAPILAAAVTVADFMTAATDAIPEAAGVGLEAALRFAAVVPEKRNRWNPAATFGCVGAALAASRLFRLGGDETAIALNIAAIQAFGFKASRTALMAGLGSGHSAMIGVDAAVLALCGMSAPVASLEVDHGWASLLFGPIDLSRVAREPQTLWALETHRKETRHRLERAQPDPVVAVERR